MPSGTVWESFAARSIFTTEVYCRHGDGIHMRKLPMNYLYFASLIYAKPMGPPQGVTPCGSLATHEIPLAA